jgi:hypothetical protein
VPDRLAGLRGVALDGARLDPALETLERIVHRTALLVALSNPAWARRNINRMAANVATVHA